MLNPLSLQGRCDTADHDLWPFWTWGTCCCTDFSHICNSVCVNCCSRFSIVTHTFQTDCTVAYIKLNKLNSQIGKSRERKKQVQVLTCCVQCPFHSIITNLASLRSKHWYFSVPYNCPCIIITHPLRRKAAAALHSTALSLWKLNTCTHTVCVNCSN